MSQREIIKTELDLGRFSEKSILNVGDFTRHFKSRYYMINAEDSQPILGS